MSRDSLRAAEALLREGRYRSSVSRAYYAAYCAATHEIVQKLTTFSYGRNNPSHEKVPTYIQNNLTISPAKKDTVSTLVSLLRLFREDADYRPHMTVDGGWIDRTGLYPGRHGSPAGTLGDQQMKAAMEQGSMTTEQGVAEIVRRYIRDVRPGGAVLEVITQGVRHDQDWWYVPVRPSVQPAKRYEYYEALAGVEKELQKSEHLTVLLVPTVPDAEPATA